jgi:CRISPR/Cas system-associated exonuclease Cas4 (RecB family)
MLTMDKIKDDVYFAFRKAQLESMKTDRKGQLHVSDVISPCMRKVWYSKNDKEKSMDTESMRALYIGQAIHNASMVSGDPKYHEIEMAYNYVTDEVVDLKKMKKVPLDDPIWWDILIGSIDDLVKINGEWVITDKKTTGSIDFFSKATSKASDSHIKQLNHYRVLLNKCMGLDAQFGCIIYIDSKNSQSFSKPIPIPFRLQPIEETLESIKTNAKILKESMLSGKMPEKTRCYLCDGMCKYASKCFEENG